MWEVQIIYLGTGGSKHPGSWNRIQIRGTGENYGKDMQGPIKHMASCAARLGWHDPEARQGLREDPARIDSELWRRRGRHSNSNFRPTSGHVCPGKVGGCEANTGIQGGHEKPDLRKFLGLVWGPGHVSQRLGLSGAGHPTSFHHSRRTWVWAGTADEGNVRDFNTGSE